MIANTYNMSIRELSFSQEENHSLFGYEDATMERGYKRLNEFYLRNDTFSKIMSDIPLNIVVSRKGVGKTALFKIAEKELQRNGDLIIMTDPIDLIVAENESLIEMIKNWRLQIKLCIVKNIISSKNKLLDQVHQIIKKIIAVKVTDISENDADIILSAVSKQKKIHIFIDDVDTQHESTGFLVRQTSAMIGAIKRLTNDYENLSFRISLRIDAYYQYRKSDQSSDKIESFVNYLEWTNNEILAMLAKRIITYFNGSVTDEDVLSMPLSKLNEIISIIFEDKFIGGPFRTFQGWEMHKVLTTVIRKRPRDLIKLCLLSAEIANKKRLKKIGAIELSEIFIGYSEGRLMDTCGEYISELENIETLLKNMKLTKREKETNYKFYKNKYIFSDTQLLKKINNIISNHNFIIKKGINIKDQSLKATAKELRAFLYKINFIIGINKSEMFYFEDRNYVADQDVDFGLNWLIHPAFHWALNPSIHSEEDIFDHYNLNEQ
jgi:hypothetical protein